MAHAATAAGQVMYLAHGVFITENPARDAAQFLKPLKTEPVL